MLAPLVVRVLGVRENCQPAPWREKLSRGKGEEKGNNKLVVPKLPKLLTVDSHINCRFNI